MTIHVREMQITDYDSVIQLMQVTPGIAVRDADSKEATARYLERNPGLSLVAEQDETIIGCVMCGHDGRRGYLQHLIVSTEYSGKGIAQRMVSTCIGQLEKLGILKTHIDVLVTNKTAIRYWEKLGWKKRDDIYRFSYIKSGSNNT
jgi:ribosomal protein S18 acetylase RimI-like enzyme